jgi:hypothetical protein
MDYGNGIHKDELPLVFNKFYRGNNVGGKVGPGWACIFQNILCRKCWVTLNVITVMMVLPSDSRSGLPE